nr:DUF302 domain-containing protein [uncultured Desulfovibrio sp.]
MKNDHPTSQKPVQQTNSPYAGIRILPVKDVALARKEIEHWLAEKGIQIFCIVDHAANAVSQNMFQPPATVIIFGNPAVGTPLMAECPLMALELPLRVLVYEDNAGLAWLAYHDPMQQAAALGANPEHTSLKQMRDLLKTLEQAVAVK